jgi:uncharacterized protein YlxW (UPF0749 family)
VFIFLFAKLDNESMVSQITGITFAFASVWFVVKVPNRWLKLTMVALDVSIILYYYLHSLFEVPIQYSAIIVAAYSGLIVFYVGRIVNEQMQSVHDTETDRLREELNRLRTSTELRELENEINRTRRRMNDSRHSETKERHQKRLDELEEKYSLLKN